MLGVFVTNKRGSGAVVGIAGWGKLNAARGSGRTLSAALPGATCSCGEGTVGQKTVAPGTNGCGATSSTGSLGGSSGAGATFNCSERVIGACSTSRLSKWSTAVRGSAAIGSNGEDAGLVARPGCCARELVDDSDWTCALDEVIAISTRVATRSTQGTFIAPALPHTPA